MNTKHSSSVILNTSYDNFKELVKYLYIFYYYHH